MKSPCPRCSFQRAFDFEPGWCPQCGQALAAPQPPGGSPFDHPLPIIQPHDWPGRPQAVTRSLCWMPRMQGTPWLALYYPAGEALAYVGPERLEKLGQQPKQAEQAAIENMARTPASWQALRLPGTDEPLLALGCIDEPHASERILERPFLGHAQWMLKSHGLAAAIPQRGMLLVAVMRDAPALMSVAQELYETAGQARLTPWVFALAEDVIGGRFFLEDGKLGVDAVIPPD